MTDTFEKPSEKSDSYFRKVSLVLKPGALEADVSYKFKLIAHSVQATDEIGESVVIIRTNSPPFKGKDHLLKTVLTGRLTTGQKVNPKMADMQRFFNVSFSPDAVISHLYASNRRQLTAKETGSDVQVFRVRD